MKHKAKLEAATPRKGLQTNISLFLQHSQTLGCTSSSKMSQKTSNSNKQSVQQDVFSMLVAE